ncbi:MAG: type III pantothenate kinase [Candidatus Omnitrophica bacterium]|nr:type III pantothenate kinase [Candidatus Omnitrophota bacterium]
MIIVIDVGNTGCTFGLSFNKKVRMGWALPTAMIRQEGRFCAAVRAELKRRAGNAPVEAVVMCSVVPAIETALARQMKKMFPGAFVGFLGKEIPVPIKNDYRYPEQVGKDRLANAVAAVYEYSVPALIVDCGTAITIDVVSGRKQYLGGVIAPGFAMSLTALHEKTALLPLVAMRSPRRLLGRDTKDSMVSGVFYGTAMLIDGLIGKFQREYKNSLLVIGTGGNVGYIKKLCLQITRFDQDLTLKGIEIAYKMMK